MYGILVITDKSKYDNYKGIFLHQSNSIDDILTYNPDINTYFQFDTEQEARTWFASWLQANGCMLHIPLNEYKFIEIIPGVNTKGYIPNTNTGQENRFMFNT